jgi:hypothetical protein
MKRAFLSLLLSGVPLFVLPNRASSKDIYIGQTALGSGNGKDAADAFSVAWFNTSGNWGAAASQISPGHTVHLCGTITSQLTVQASGTSGNPTTILFEPDANITMPYLPTTGAINLGTRNFLTIDGGQNGLIQATANGVTNANQVISSAIWGSGNANVTVQNVTMTNLFMRTSGDSETASSRPGVTGVFFPNNLSNIVVRNCKISWAGTPIMVQYTAAYNIQIYSNVVQWCNWGIAVGQGNVSNFVSGLTIHDNRVSGFSPWDDPADKNHHDGIFPWATLAGCAITNVTIYNNIIGPNFGTLGHCTAALYLSGAAGTFSNVLIYNNVMFGTNGAPSEGLMMLSGIQACGVYNNTIDGGSASGNFVGIHVSAGTNVIVMDNVISLTFRSQNV